MFRGPSGLLACALVATTVAGCVAGCGDDLTNKPKPPLEVVVKATSDPGRALAGVSVVYAGKTIKETDDEGTARLVLTGNEGDVFEVTIKCPAGHQSPTKPLAIPLRRLAEPSKTPEYEVSCPPTTRTVVVAVRAENGANLPVLHLGRVLGRTDASGAATVLLEKVETDTQFELALDTTEKGNEGLRPQNPASVFSVKRADDVLTFDVKFTVEKKPVVWKGPKKTGPIALPTKKMY